MRGLIEYFQKRASVDDAAELDDGLAGATGLEGGIGHGRELGEDGKRALIGAVAVGLGDLSSPGGGEAAGGPVAAGEGKKREGSGREKEREGKREKRAGGGGDGKMRHIERDFVGEKENVGGK
ncbi:hypothetical protein L484_026476 [Morus notabilis]|uniref:Uncharacterized protein n=1 Tax=Morus notabilis TaxID=981085 RepID=W9QWC7_9ROSA|nr:hypothetical protein L484_026476 [Morus notabilis]